MLYKHNWIDCPYYAIPYKIHHNDNVYKISKYFNISINDIIFANPKNNIYSLTVGQIIYIPLKRFILNYTHTKNYIMKPGDNLNSIIKNFDTNKLELAKINSNYNLSKLDSCKSILVPFSLIEYINRTYKVIFKYPSHWRKSSSTRYDGPDGFFQIWAINSENSFDEICKKEAFNLLRPYGKNPTIKLVKTYHQSSCFIFPSGDQPIPMKHQSALIIKYPKPVRILEIKYNYFVLYGNKQNIQEIAKSIRFLHH